MKKKSILQSKMSLEVDGIYYNKNGDGTVSVTFKGSSYNEYANEYTGDVIIPSSVTYSGTTYSVTSIGDDAFQGCSGLTSVTIPNSVTSIGDDAFRGCSGLTRVDISSLEAWLGIKFADSGSNPLYYAHHLYLNGEEVKDLVIPNSVTSIGEYAFCGCSGLTSVTIPNSVTSIGDWAFHDCSGLESIVVESGNSKYDSRDNCNAIIETATNTLLAGCKNTTIPNSVTSIGDDAFWGCSGLTSVTIPNSVTSIGEYAFYGCSGLTSVTIPNSVTSIGSSAFCDCSGLTRVDISSLEAWLGIKFADYGSNPLYYAHHLYLNGEEVKDLVIPNSVTSIGDDAFCGCSGLKSVTIPNSVTSIGNSAFQDCSGLKSVTIPNSVTSIGDDAFCGCSGLKSVTIPNSVTSIGDDAFRGCSDLTSVTIPNSVTSIGDNAFSRCSGLESIVVESGNSKYDSRDNCNAIIETATNTLLAGCKNTTIPNSVTSIGDFAFCGCSGLTSVTIPNSVTSIGDAAFFGCRGLTSVTISNSVTSIGDDAFFGCRGLTSVTIPNSVTSIGDDAFFGCRGLTSVTISNSVTSIGDDAFFGCSGLTSVTIPNSVTSIGKSVFEDCSGLESIVVESGNSKYDSRDNCNAIIETATNTLLAGCKNTTIPNSVTSIGDNAFEGCSGLKSASIPNSVTYIGEYAFWDCSSLKKAIVKAITPPYIASKSFNNYDLKLIVPAISKEEYKSANIWSSFTNYADAEIMITALGLEKNNASIKSGETIQLTATATPADATFADVFLWTSGNEDVATVDGNGVVTAIADGTATITASTVDGSNITAACVVSVGAGAVEGVDTAAARIYTADGNIIIAAAEDGEAAVYDFTGHLIKSVPVASGNSTAVPVTPGYYIVKTGTKTQSVVVK